VRRKVRSHFPAVELRVLESEEQAARATAELLVEAARAGKAIVLTGGTTPRRSYELAAELEPDWGRARLWWGDERCVPPEHEWSNYGMAKAALLDRLANAPAEVHRIDGEVGPEEAAARYDRALRGATLELVLLGLGPDGHTASLYPNAPTLDERERLAVPAEAELEPFVDRVTLTIPGLESSAEMVYLVAGESKADAVKRAFETPPSPATPASLIRSRGGRTLAILDSAAATRLEGAGQDAADSYI
jgi:6-phosphogluconolactonase